MPCSPRPSCSWPHAEATSGAGHTVEARLSTYTDAVLADVGEKLDRQLDAYGGPRLGRIEALGEGGDPPPLDELVDEVRQQYREKATGLMAEVCVAYAREIGGANDYLIHLRDGEHLTPREQIEKDIVESSVALRRHHIVPIEPIGVAEETTQRGRLRSDEWTRVP